MVEKEPELSLKVYRYLQHKGFIGNFMEFMDDCYSLIQIWNVKEKGTDLQFKIDLCNYLKAKGFSGSSSEVMANCYLPIHTLEHNILKHAVNRR